jgi:hypothetical protein
MAETAQPTPGDGRPPAQTPTGEIKDQATPSATPTETKPTETTPPPAQTSDTPPPAPDGDKSLVNAGQKAEKTPEAAPEAYAEFKVPEGTELDPTAATEAQALFKGLNLSQESAQKLVDFYVSKTNEAFQQPFKAYRDMRDGWVKDAKAHTELSGKLEPNGPVLSTIARAIDGLGDAALASEFRAAMDLTGAGDHPAFIRTFYKMAQALTEGRPVAGSGPSRHGQVAPGDRAGTSIASRLYPNLP